MMWDEPQHGDKRTVRLFAWLPKVVGRKKIWFEHYEEDQIWGTWGGGGYYFTEWIMVERRLL